MKKRIATLLTLALSATVLLGGCGGGSKTTPKSIVDRKEKTIAYITQNYEKDSELEKVIVFEAGAATLYDAGDYTMGDFAQMTDDEVIENLLKRIDDKNNAEIEKYQGYITEKESAIDNSTSEAISIENSKNCYENLQVALGEGSIEDLFVSEYGVEYLETNYEMVEYWMENFYMYLDEHLTDDNRRICEALYHLASKNEDELFGQGTSLAEDWQNYMTRHEGEKFSPLFEGYVNTDKVVLEDVNTATELFDTVIAEGIASANEAVSSNNQEQIDSLQQEIDSYNQKIEELQNKEIAGKSYPTVVNLMTDGTGNGVLLEAFVMLGEDSIEYAIGLRDIVYSGDSRKAIYDSQYAVYGVTTDGSNIDGFMLIRDNSKNGETFGIDTLETKDVYIDAEEFDEFTK